MNVLFTKELQRQLDEEGVPITAISLHPGSVATEGATTKPNTPWFINFYMKSFATPPLDGAFTTLFAATDAHVAAERDKYKGGYLVPFGQLKEPSVPARDPKLACTLWETSERVVKEVLVHPA
ncbi:hypothetical protein EWM64_g4498 [Hericium alpestre]|uniref:Uncharacterized protein n=1 Tax=Hericium alpestre TaxID=135208 RepID=A0A4Y9ZZ93_9AGAM|nr:hypothetical protein EWM64_g4498 [Hericium alpestre]